MITRQKTTALAVVALAAASFGVAPAAIAQTAPSNSPTAAPDAGSTNIDAHKLKSFAVAYLQVDKIKRQYQPKLANADSNDEKQKIQSEASQKMVSAVNGVDDMSVKEYSSIIASAKKDPTLAKKLSNEIRKTAKSAQ